MDVERTIIKIACQCFKADPAALSLASTPFGVDGWDSLSHVLFISTVEEVFNLTFSRTEIRKLRSLDDVRKAILRQLDVPNLGPADY